MLPVQRVRRLLSDHIGQQLTPELATAIELSAMTQRDKVDRLAGIIEHMPQVDCPVDHFFAPGVCLRRISIPKGATVTGAEHKREHLIVVTKGALLAVTNDESVEVQAGDVLRCLPGAANAVHALTDASWLNVLVTDETDTAAIVEQFTDARETDLLGGSTNKQLANQHQLELEF